jgi:hypothetical protein
MVSPTSYRRLVLTDVMASYLGAAQAAGADLYPAGGAWFAAWQCVPGLALYGPDGFHPSRVGTYAAALVVYGRLFKAPLLQPALRPGWLTPRVARLAQASAARALGRRVPVGRRCGG